MCTVPAGDKVIRRLADHISALDLAAEGSGGVELVLERPVQPVARTKGSEADDPAPPIIEELDPGTSHSKSKGSENGGHSSLWHLTVETPHNGKAQPPCGSGVRASANCDHSWLGAFVLAQL